VRTDRSTTTATFVPTNAHDPYLHSARPVDLSQRSSRLTLRAMPPLAASRRRAQRRDPHTSCILASGRPLFAGRKNGRHALGSLASLRIGLRGRYLQQKSGWHLYALAALESHFNPGGRKAGTRRRWARGKTSPAGHAEHAQSCAPRLPRQLGHWAMSHARNARSRHALRLSPMHLHNLGSTSLSRTRGGRPLGAVGHARARRQLRNRESTHGELSTLLDDHLETRTQAATGRSAFSWAPRGPRRHCGPALGRRGLPHSAAHRRAAVGNSAVKVSSVAHNDALSWSSAAAPSLHGRTHHAGGARLGRSCRGNPQIG
jgi:hypothetical protein